MVLTNLGTVTVDALSGWINFNPIIFNDTKKIYAVYCLIESATPDQIFSQFVFRYTCTLETGDFLTSSTIASMHFNFSEQFFPVTIWDKIDKDFPITFSVKRIPYYRALNCLGTATVRLRVDPNQKLQDA